MQTSRHRCPRPCTYRLATSTPLPSLSHPPRTRRRVVDHRGHSPGRANRGRRAKNAGVATGRAAAAACRWRKNASSIAEAAELAATAWARARSRADRRRAKTNLPHWYAVAARKHYFVSLNYPQKTPPERETLAQLRPVDRLHAHRLELRRVRAPHDPQHDVGPDFRLLDER